MNESHQILVRIPESHTSSYSTLKEGSRTAHAEGNHTLILIPDIHHSVQALVGALYLVFAQQFVPQRIQFRKSGIYRLYRHKTLDYIARALLIYNMVVFLSQGGKDGRLELKLLILLILCLSEHEDIVFALARL